MLSVGRPGEERALRFVAMMLFLQRISYLVPVATLSVVVVAVGWNVVLADLVRRRGLVPRWAVGVDVVLVCVLLAVDRPGGFALATGVLSSYFWYMLIAYVTRRHQRRAADQARHAERRAQHRRLHDTVLTTLTAIARGALDHRADAVRSRCAAEADYVRRLIAEDAGPATDLGTRLDEVITEAEQRGLRVRYQHDRLPTELPENVVEAITGASREALNNVLTHAGTDAAWLTAIHDEDRLLVRIVDRGRGFDPTTAPAGFGHRSSITERMREAGGEATLVSAPGTGVRVDLVWPAHADPGRAR